MGRCVHGFGVVISIGAAYLVMQFASIMDYIQALFSFFIIPLFGTVIIGMLWKRATPAGGFWGLLAGMATSIGLWLWVKLDPSALSIIAMSHDAKAMAENLYRFIWSWAACVLVTLAVSLVTRPKPIEELGDLVYGVTPMPSQGRLPLHHRPFFWAAIVFAIFVVVNILFW